ncbi:hypothetical protein F4779DRAFT_259785 [Xylariaceae sp. FL0662B]|nr:hypothetical protein F4779DRAFT_259785 [Xylariaceae sp. FL0662B]
MMHSRLFHLALLPALSLPFIGVYAALDPGILTKHTPHVQSCAETSTPTTFVIKGLVYLRYEVGPYPMESQPNSTQLAFEVTNSANGVSTGCSFQNVMYEGQWPDDSDYWHACSDRTFISTGGSYPVRTNARFLWDAWKLSVNQSWACDEVTSVNYTSTTTLEPNCTETRSEYQYINECVAPDVEVTATLQ